MQAIATKQPTLHFHVITVCLLLLFCTKGLCADSTQTAFRKNILFVTFGGKENFGSLNYEHIFSIGKKMNWSYSIGVQPFQLSKKFSAPVSINAFTKGRLHHLELELTGTFYMDKFHPYNGGYHNDFNKQLYVSPFVCYRLQGSRGLVLKTGVGPQVLFDPPSYNVFAFRTRVLGPSVFASVGMSF